MRRVPAWLLNLTISVVAVLLFLVFCELIVFRFVWPASDVPRNAFRNELVRYEPHQRGVWRVRDEIAAPFAINAQGWNSGTGDYVLPRRPGVERIAVVGDSFVEALQVPADSSFAELLPRRHDETSEVYRFAISGAPMSQYLHMIEREVLAYRPDAVVVLLVHNDFDESFLFKGGRYTSSFLKLRIEGGEVVGEIPPEPWRPRFIELVRQTATARFFYYRWQVRPRQLIDMLLPQARADRRFAANVEINRVLEHEPEIRAATDHVVRRIRDVVGETGAKLLLVMDGDRSGIYAGQDTTPALALNRIAAEAAARHGVPFVDLHPAFTEHWRSHGQPFDFFSDNHWNERGHALAAEAIGSALATMGAAERR